MTLIPAGAHLAPVDLPPPPPASDPREPSPATTSTRRGARTPVRARSPMHSRSSSPTRPPQARSPSSTEPGSLSPAPAAAPPLQAPSPRHLSSSSSGATPIAHHSRSSSPASMDSHGSAIFERDIEYPAVASLSLNPAQPAHHTLAHKPSRLSHLTHGSALDHTVPAVLDDAVEALAADRRVEVEAPATGLAGVNMARQSSASLHQISSGKKVPTSPSALGQSASRSSSPMSTASIPSPAQSPPIMGQLSAQQQTLGQAGPGAAGVAEPSAPSGILGDNVSTPRPSAPKRISTGPMLPGGWSSAYGGTGAGAGMTSAEKQEKENLVDSLKLDKLPEPAVPLAVAKPQPSPPIPSPPPALPSHLTPQKDKRRISFISYNDLLLSVPTQVTPLDDITSGTTSPDHLPGTVSPSLGDRSPVMPPPGGSSGLNPSLGEVLGVDGGSRGGVEKKGSWEVGRGASSGLGLGEGEWEREGLGKGLVQRLEDVASGH